VTPPSTGLPTHFNPWLEIWYRPRATIRRVLHTTSNNTIWLLAAIAGIDNTLSRAAIVGEGEERGVAVLGSVLMWGMIWGMARLLGTAGIVTWVGRKLGGVATMNHSVVALAWSSVPQGLSLLLWIPEMLLGGMSPFSHTSLQGNGNPAGGIIWWIFTLVTLVLNGWQIALTVITVAEVHQISIARSVATLMVPLLVVVLFLLLVFIFFGGS
jgi:hypothetical protein